MGKTENQAGKRAVLFAGTTEGRLLAEYLASVGCQTVVCVATEYGRDILGEWMDNWEERDNLRERTDTRQKPMDGRRKYMDIRQGRLDQAGMERLLKEVGPGMVIDATHPYAVEVSRNIKRACELSHGPRLLRCLRENSAVRCVDKHTGNPEASQPPGRHPGAGKPHTGQTVLEKADIIHVPDIKAAVDWLGPRPGNILVTTGSKELGAFCGLEDYRQRVYARVLPSVESVGICRSLGYEGRHIIAAQGPFSSAFNLAMVKEYNCRYLVTKDGGRAGGLEEKLEAALEAGITAVLVDRPDSGQGFSLEETKKQIKEWMDHET